MLSVHSGSFRSQMLQETASHANGCHTLLYSIPPCLLEVLDIPPCVAIVNKERGPLGKEAKITGWKVFKRDWVSL